MLRLFVALAYLSPLGSISPCLAADAYPTRSRELTIDRFVQKLKRDGQVTQFTPVLVKLMGFSADSTKRGLEADGADGLNRIADIVFSKVDADEPVPVGLYWTTRREAERKSEMYFYRSSLDGGLEKAVRVDGQLDASGNDVRGASKATTLDVSDAEVRERFQREVLDFWLKGRGRKMAGVKAKRKK